ncbi:MAG: acyl-CoA dehydrogenase, partial [Breznakibacter sp.]|nr:acyl-CoA dehydrogenase [Breznakibacter sp.]
RLVEMAGNIIMGYLLLLDTNRDDRFNKSLQVFVKMGRAENKAKFEFVSNSTINDLGIYKQE